jgi:hypothetical protein
MVVPAMTQGNPRIRKNDSVIGLLVWYNILQIRQRLIDEYWWNRQLEKDKLSGVNRPTLRSMKAAERVQFLHDVTPLVNDELGPLSYYPEDGVALPASMKTSKEFAEATGIDENRFDELNARNQIPDVEELVAIARLGDVDIAYMFMPTMDILETDRKIILKSISGHRSDVEAHRWVLWVRSMMNLPGQAGKKYLQETAIPSKKRMTADGRSARSYAEIERDLKERTQASTSAIKAIADEITKIAQVANIDVNTLNPFELGRLARGYEPERGKAITLGANLFMAQTRKILSMFLNSASDKQRLKNRFGEGVIELHRSLYRIIQTLRAIHS